jgi:hypothetical protein
MKYQYITKQESSAADAAFIYRQSGVNNLTYLPGIYSDSPLQSHSVTDFFVGVPDSVIKKLYITYFMDFVMYNYTIDEYLSK